MSEITLDERITYPEKISFSVVDEIIKDTWPQIKVDYEDQIIKSLELVVKVMMVLAFEIKTTTDNTVDKWRSELLSSWCNLFRLRKVLDASNAEISFSSTSGTVITPIGNFTMGSFGVDIDDDNHNIQIIKRHFPDVVEREEEYEPGDVRKRFVLPIDPVRYLVPADFIDEKFREIVSKIHRK